MKNLLTLSIALLVFACLSAQEKSFPINSIGQLEYAEIVDSKLTQGQLYSNAQEWIARTFGDYKSVIQFEDKENGKLIIKGLSVLKTKAEFPNMVVTEKINYIITIECKDNKFRYKIDGVDIARKITIIFSDTPLDLKLDSPDKHLELIEGSKEDIIRYRKTLDSIKLLNSSLLKKKQIKENNAKAKEAEEDIASSLLSIKAEQDFFDEEYLIFNSIVFSLKQAMNTDNTF